MSSEVAVTARGETGSCHPAFTVTRARSLDFPGSAKTVPSPAIVSTDPESPTLSKEYQ